MDTDEPLLRKEPAADMKEGVAWETEKESNDMRDMMETTSSSKPLAQEPPTEAIMSADEATEDDDTTVVVWGA